MKAAAFFNHMKRTTSLPYNLKT